MTLRKHPGKPLWWEVVEPETFEDKDVTYTVHSTFVTNFASIPAFLFPFVPPHGPSAIPSVKHDYRYIYLVGATKLGLKGARKSADVQYLHDLREAGCGRLASWLMYAGVRAFGSHFICTIMYAAGAKYDLFIRRTPRKRSGGCRKRLD